MMELYFKIKLYETLIGYILLGFFILFWIIVFIINCFGKKWDKRQEKKSEKFWREHEQE